ncbi:signal peptide peptidase (macronuclear) [Tetrahymena thermophila SB210]|uniref:Signal peptide peptidase n=1 Tax=Tetrahymena thermophila (strain SB210) TaxID=312017 RepID=Q22L19_TETTS|nr:signal peptide peptidase [Tetrahymena thermophila SB210]EAR85998.1 signal peptide peptidase [Tetrahymena thermophila SB210]|eukprot:XP_976593.1 signal peptide peptidase [Tetrahymena thermophila SB210]
MKLCQHNQSQIFLILIFGSIIYCSSLSNYKESEQQLQSGQCQEENILQEKQNQKEEYGLRPLQTYKYLQQNQQKLNIQIQYNTQIQSINQGESIEVYNNYKLSKQFDQSLWNRQCCSRPDNLYNYNFESNENPGLIIQNLHQNTDIIVSTNIKTQFTDGLRPSIMYLDQNLNPPPPQQDQVLIKSGEKGLFQILTACPSHYNFENYWTAISITIDIQSVQVKTQANNEAQEVGDEQISESINVYYFFVCDEKFRPVKYAVSLNILVIVLSIIVLVMAIYSTPLSISSLCQTRPQSNQINNSTYSQISNQRKFERYELKYYHASVYAALVITIGISNIYINHDRLEKIMDIIMAILTSFSTWFFTNELQCHSKWIKKRVQIVFFTIKYFKFQLMDLISLCFTAILEFLWLYFGKTWYFSDILALFLLGSLMKFLKFKSLKQAFMFLSICLLVDAIGALIVYFKEDLSYDILFINQYNEPFLIAIRSINIIYDKYCSWLPVTGTAFPGILINYCYRYDRSYQNYNTRAFTYLGLFGYFFSSIIYMIIATFNIHQWPYSTVNYPIMCLFILLFAYKRSEHLYLWNGSFYDVVEIAQQFVEDGTDRSASNGIVDPSVLYSDLQVQSVRNSESLSQQVQLITEHERISGQSINQ